MSKSPSCAWNVLSSCTYMCTYINNWLMTFNKIAPSSIRYSVARSFHYKTLKTLFVFFFLIIWSPHIARESNLTRQSLPGRYRLNEHVYSYVKRSFWFCFELYLKVSHSRPPMTFSVVHSYVNIDNNTLVEFRIDSFLPRS